MESNIKNKSKISLNLVSGIDIKSFNIDGFNDVIGQESVIKKLQFYMNSVNSGGSGVFPTMLFTGSHGLGKTYVARVLASSLNRRFLEINCGAIGDAKSFVEGILLDRVIGQSPVTILLDEAHKLSDEITTILLTLLAPSSNNMNIIEYKGWKLCYDMRKINTILSTTDSFKIFPPLVNRCETLYFKAYSNSDLIKMLQFYLPNCKINLSSNFLDEIAYACRGRARDTYSLAQKIKGLCNAKSIFTDNDWRTIKEIFGIYPMGLNEQELNLMRIIRVAGNISCANIAARMMVGEQNVAEEIENRPRELWLVGSSPKGRSLTEFGENYFNDTLKETVEETKHKIGG